MMAEIIAEDGESDLRTASDYFNNKKYLTKKEFKKCILKEFGENSKIEIIFS
jgi:hypothetical protein